MARERISLVDDAVKREAALRAQILDGEMTPEVFAGLPEDDKVYVNNVLFKMASEKIEPNQGTSALEFILFGFMRIMTKKMNGVSLNADDQEVESKLNAILSIHQITDGKTMNSDWLFDYMGYAYKKSEEFLQNRKEHIERKINTIGEA
ncbi:hypothetical protein GZH47_32600 (plasmid) [Paenibacillus rhizovicinus]|uniref:Uncharacterized protein n=1 Tax=Paenibacillus rhizovicinus TaxID=2704463 RepID=A0A6C0PAN0_9BACL|nr:hypothetical protein [Paenibacillus rhizovicinus]QHW35640.1 hypothetical protein GZH47_32600 [Paenibacillus rhizovicinus]